jgi:hypothetical protein
MVIVKAPALAFGTTTIKVVPTLQSPPMAASMAAAVAVVQVAAAVGTPRMMTLKLLSVLRVAVAGVGAARLHECWQQRGGNTAQIKDRKPSLGASVVGR